jgi:hypothetical protein
VHVVLVLEVVLEAGDQFLDGGRGSGLAGEGGIEDLLYLFPFGCRQ